MLSFKQAVIPVITAVLGVNTIEYLPFALFPLLMPVSNILITFFEK